jgi:hypothetical protein
MTNTIEEAETLIKRARRKRVKLTMGKGGIVTTNHQGLTHNWPRFSCRLLCPLTCILIEPL